MVLLLHQLKYPVFAGHIDKAGETITTKTEWHTVKVNGVPTTVLTNVTTVRDASGKIVNTFYSSNNVGDDQLTSGSNLDGSTRSKTWMFNGC